ncbi:MAG: winged helix-turn-helix transcriptional regulator [Chlamydiales bacterium]|nr:winged helix-turn-helix transcriptional regulator [Chlamydiales bacterium]
MLRGLFGSKSVERILLFMLVNERAYATQLHRMLNTPLTPIQKALSRLEREGILKSRYEGKTRFYTFDPDYPLLNELEALLKKAYVKLAPSEKKDYYFVRHIPKPNKDLLEEIWRKLRATSHVTFRFRSRRSKGEGTGSVTAVYEGGNACVFHEKGVWRGLEGQEFTFRNVFRWTLNRIEGMFTLEHLRFGEKNPVFLFHLAPVNEQRLESLHAHLCGEDTYFGQLAFQPPNLELTWRVLGPKKNDEVRYTYS